MYIKENNMKNNDNNKGGDEGKSGFYMLPLEHKERVAASFESHQIVHMISTAVGIAWMKTPDCDRNWVVFEKRMRDLFQRTLDNFHADVEMFGGSGQEDGG